MTKEIRKHILSLISLMQYANSRRDGKWAWQSSDPTMNGVYGCANSALEAILVELYGKRIATLAMDRIIDTGMEDVLDAIQDGIDENLSCAWDALRDYADMWAD